VQLFGTDSAQKKAAPKKNVEHIKRVLLSVHGKAALALGNDDIAIDEEEAQMLAESLANFLEYYKIVITGKRGAAVALLYAVSMVYGPRLFAMVLKRRIAKEALTAKQEGESNGSEAASLSE
jgi:hypothetical protein